MPIKVNNVEITTNKINNSNVSEEKLNGTKVYPSIYTVRFYDFSGGSLLKTEQVQQGGNATAPANPTRTGYTWLGWDKSYTNVQSNLDVYGTWQINTYTVRFYDFQGTGNTLLKTETVISGGNATAPTDPVRTGYQFTGWAPPYTNITTNTDIYGQWVLASTNYWAYIDETSGFIDDPAFANTTAYDYDNVITNATEAQAFLEHIFPARNQNVTYLGLVYNQVIDYCWIFEVHS